MFLYLVKILLYYLISFSVLELSIYTFFDYLSKLGNFFLNLAYYLSKDIVLISSVIISITSLVIEYLLFFEVGTSENMAAFIILCSWSPSTLIVLCWNIYLGRFALIGFSMLLCICVCFLLVFDYFLFESRFCLIFLWNMLSPILL